MIVMPMKLNERKNAHNNVPTSTRRWSFLVSTEFTLGGKKVGVRKFGSDAGLRAHTRSAQRVQSTDIP
jgi:hypothetical protein